MPDYQFNTNLGPAQQQGTSLGDLINTARGVQAYQQAEQANPLAIQKAKMEIEQAQKLNPLAVRQQAAQTGSAELGLNAAQTERLYGLAGGVLNDPRIKSGNKEQVLGVLYEAKQRASTYGIPENVIDGVFNPLMTLGDQNPKAVKQTVQNIVQTGLGAAGQQALQSGAVVDINGIKYRYDPATGTAKEIPLPGAAQTNNVPPVEKPAEAKTSGSLFQIDTPRAQGQFNEQEKGRYESGAADWKASTERAQAASDSALASSQIRRSLASAAGSKPGQLVRSAGKALFGNAEYDTLLKNLAEQQVRQAKLMGIDSVHAQQDLATANGSGDITPEALGHIVDRADAMNTATKKYNQALDAMQRKYGKDKAYLNNDNFKKAWGDNYDPVAFIIQSTNARNIPAKEKEAIIGYYTDHMSQRELDELANKMRNLKRLERGDF